MYNLEATPAEGTTYRLDRLDKEKYPDIKTSGTEDRPYYTNSTHLPVGHTNDIFLAELSTLGLPIKLDTNGYFPERLSTIFEKRLVDYFAMDIKGPLDSYAKRVGLRNIYLWA